MATLFINFYLFSSAFLAIFATTSWRRSREFPRFNKHKIGINVFGAVNLSPDAVIFEKIGAYALSQPKTLHKTVTATQSLNQGQWSDFVIGIG